MLLTKNEFIPARKRRGHAEKAKFTFDPSSLKIKLLTDLLPNCICPSSALLFVEKLE